jgi:transposase
MVDYTTKEGIKTAYFYDEGFSWNKDIKVKNPEMLPQYVVYSGMNTLAGRLKMGLCEMCNEKTDDIRMFQVKKVKDLKGDKPHEQIMKEKRRKTLAVCRKCFDQISNNICLKLLVDVEPYTLRGVRTVLEEVWLKPATER